MSWDIFVWASTSPPPPAKKMPNDWKGLPLGPLAAVKAQISAVLPDTDWSEPGWGQVQVGDASVNFNIGEDDPCENLAIHVYGNGNPVPQIMELLIETGWYALDTGQGEWLHIGEPLDAGWTRFKAYRDKVFASIRRDSS